MKMPAPRHQDARGTFVSAKDLPKGCRPPYRSTVVWRGEHGEWRLEAVRVDGDPLIHCVAHHQTTGIAHAERIDQASPAKLKAWAQALPSHLPPVPDEESQS